MDLAAFTRRFEGCVAQVVAKATARLGLARPPVRLVYEVHGLGGTTPARFEDAAAAARALHVDDAHTRPAVDVALLRVAPGASTIFVRAGGHAPVADEALGREGPFRELVVAQLAAVVAHAEAGARAEAGGAVWTDLAHGVAALAALERGFGPSTRDDFLPGLGALHGWGLVGALEARPWSGSILTGFQPEPTAVTLHLAARAVGDRLALDALEALLTLPGGGFDRFALHSLRPAGPCLEVTDRGAPVLETTSRSAARLARALVEHFVPAAEVSVAAGEASGAWPLFVRVGADGRVEGQRASVDASQLPAWRRIGDYDD